MTRTRLLSERERERERETRRENETGRGREGGREREEGGKNKGNKKQRKNKGKKASNPPSPALSPSSGIDFRFPPALSSLGPMLSQSVGLPSQPVRFSFHSASVSPRPASSLPPPPPSRALSRLASHARSSIAYRLGLLQKKKEVSDGEEEGRKR